MEALPTRDVEVEEFSRGETIQRAEALKEVLESDGWAVFADAVASRAKEMQVALLNGSVHDQVGRYERSIGEMRGLGLLAEVAQEIIDRGAEAEAEARMEE